MTKYHDISLWQHHHNFGTAHERHAEQRTRWVVGLAFIAMVIEITVGWLTGSMALLADGWHMASHVGALGIAVYAYRFSRQHANESRYTFGTGKVSALAGYSSALTLGAVALWMLMESVTRLLSPVQIQFTEAMIVAGIGLIVNLLSVWILDHDHAHPHGNGQNIDHDHEHFDHNLKAAYMHVLADAFTSVLAILALAGGMLFSLHFLDPLMGIIGAGVVGRWAWELAQDSADVLLDAEDHGHVATEIRQIIGSLSDHEIVDLHLWRIGPASRACILSVVSHNPLMIEAYRQQLSAIHGLDHITVEINQCRQCS